MVKESNCNEDQISDVTTTVAKSPLSLTFKICFGLGHVLNELCSIIWFTYLIVYLQYTLKLSSSLAGIVLLVGQVTDAVCTPIIGMESDNWQGNCSLLGGRRKSWFLIGTICVALSFPTIFMGCFGCKQVQVPYLTLLIPLVIIFQFGWAATQVSHLALIPELTKVDHERDSLNNIRCALNEASELLAFAVAYIVFAVNTTGPKDAENIGPEDGPDFRELAIIITIIGVFFSSIFFINIKEESNFTKSEASVKLKDHPKAPISWKYWITNRQFYRVGAIYLFSRMYDNLSQVFFPLYLQECKAAPEIMIVVIPMIMKISGLLTTMALGFINKRIGKKVSFGVICLISAIGSGMLCLHNHKHFKGPGEIIMAVLIGTGGSSMVAMALSLIPELLAENVSSAAFVYGILSAIEKLGNGCAVAIIQYIYQINCQSSHCYWFYRSVMVYVLSAIAILCFLCILTLISVDSGKPARHFHGIKDNFVKTATALEEQQPLLKKNGKFSTKIIVGKISPPGVDEWSLSP